MGKEGKFSYHGNNILSNGYFVLCGLAFNTLTLV